MPRRVDRINGLLRQEISQLLSRQIKDPRLIGVISITEVRTSSDLRNAQVYVSVMGDQEAQNNALEGIRSAAAYLRRELRDRLSMRYVPFLKFVLDKSIEDADQLLNIMDGIRDQEKQPPLADDAPNYDGPLAFPPYKG
jgi:ribosome-binding factor A